MFVGILITGITMCIPRDTLIDIFNDDIDGECRVLDNGNNRNGYQSIKQNDFGGGKAQIIKQVEPDGSSSVDISSNEERNENKPKGTDDNDKLKHVV